MSVRRLPPSAPNGLDESIEDYVMKLPLTSTFREHNPNLHPLDIDTGSSDTSTSSRQNMSVNSASSHSTASASPKLLRSQTFRLKLRIPLPKSTSFNDAAASNSSSPRKRFSLNLSLNRLSLSARSTPTRSPSRYLAGDDDIETASISSERYGSPAPSANQTPYWKYHVLKFGKDLYLTTNPGLKHIYCRNGPSYYVEVVYPNKKKKIPANGYTLIFKELDGVEKNDGKPPIMMIYKKPETEGGHYTLSIPQRSRLVQDSIEYSAQPQSLFHGIVMPKGIDNSYIPYDRIANGGRYQELRNYEFKDCQNFNWNVGAIPRLRVSTLNRLKNRMMQEEEEDALKLFGPRNVYFHQNYIDTRQKRRIDGDADYLANASNEFPPVLAMFRPVETKFRRRLMTKLNRMLQSKLPNRLFEQPAATVGLDVKTFHELGDGLYYQTHPADDEPGENKLGWLTVYEDRQVFADHKYRGMFDIVLGLTLAIGFETHMNWSEEKESP